MSLDTVTIIVEYLSDHIIEHNTVCSKCNLVLDRDKDNMPYIRPFTLFDNNHICFHGFDNKKPRVIHVNIYDYYQKYNGLLLHGECFDRMNNFIYDNYCSTCQQIFI